MGANATSSFAAPVLYNNVGGKKEERGLRKAWDKI